MNEASDDSTAKRITIWVEWGYELHSLRVDSDDWATIKSGTEVVLDGEGYFYEGEQFSDSWHFKGGIGGSLNVYYRGEDSEDSEGEGYIGTLDEDMIVIEDE